ncbi:BfmA/BtgA family mobilization protein [Winogradskyella schleiferi]|uniref:BfmA/BtgA family mobilization protein n=1 Tax=Winogradskyella schleiferi TaxID=2686078 RepID=UPI001E62CE10|nr:BfmA/BtgA family mobilization protein [Winogradskyella schleiferi]
MDTFTGIRFKKETAKRFQTFSRTHFKSHTEAMSTMLDFFFYNEISPKEKLGPTGRTIEAKLLKRINAVIAIMRDMEKSQTKPTTAMLQSLFVEIKPVKKQLLTAKSPEEVKAKFENRNKETQSKKGFKWKR